jgi:hypothetical protein
MDDQQSCHRQSARRQDPAGHSAHRREARQLCCGEVGRAFDVAQATVSHRLKIRRRAPIESRREGSSSA